MIQDTIIEHICQTPVRLLGKFGEEQEKKKP